ncbi:Uncharacterised protein [Vibrio cholerae]|nr:Uncharacterised protein [Vibrio cholerae]
MQWSDPFDVSIRANQYRLSRIRCVTCPVLSIFGLGTDADHMYMRRHVNHAFVITKQEQCPSCVVKQ